MRKYTINSLAILIAIALSAFTAHRPLFKKNKKFAAFYLLYQGGNQGVLANYSVGTTHPGTCATALYLCWIRVTDYNSNGICDQSEFYNTFITLDEDGDNSLDDEGELEDLLEKGWNPH